MHRLVPANEPGSLLVPCQYLGVASYHFVLLRITFAASVPAAVVPAT
jgi:hypothetical protein